MLQIFKPNFTNTSGKSMFRVRVLSIFPTVLLALLVFSGYSAASPEIGKKSPDFTAVDSHGNEIRLSQFLGKVVVLEWTNHECPYVRKHYRTGNMQSLQKEATDQDVVWLSIISSAPGRQGYLTGQQANALTTKRKAFPSAVLLDAKGDIGHAYGATATPNMFVIDKVGNLVYKGAIDNKPSASTSDVKTAKNYVRAALQAIAAGKSLQKSVSRPYGCTIKYAY